MGNLLYLALAVGLSTLGVAVLWVLRHRPRSMQQQIDAFHRELQALRPADGGSAPAGGHVDRVEPTPIRPRSGPPAARPRAPRPQGSARSNDHDDRRRSATES